MSSGNASAPERWVEAASEQNEAAIATSGSWRHSTSCVQLNSSAGLPQLRCLAYNLHCKPEDAPCANSRTAYINTTLFTLHKKGSVTASNGGLATFTFPSEVLPSRDLKGACQGKSSATGGGDCPAYSYAGYVVGLAHSLKSGGNLQLTSVTTATPDGNGEYAPSFPPSTDCS